MRCLLLFSLLFLPAVYGRVMFKAHPTAIASTLTSVSWTREDRHPVSFDVRIVNEDTDIGMLVTTINAAGEELGGIFSVTFPNPGCFMLQAVNVENDTVIGSSRMIFVHANTTISEPVEMTSIPSQSTLPTASTDIVTTTTTPSLDGSSTSAADGTIHTPSNASSKSRVNTVAIVGGVMGGVILIFILAILFVLIKRKKAKSKRRLTFKQHLMVQHRLPIAPDIEQGRTIDTNPTLPPLNLQLPITMPAPQGPTRTQSPASALRSPGSAYPPTHRQVQLSTRIVQLENQMSSIRRQNRGQLGVETVLEHMKRQVEWLRAERDKPWARCETDVPPPALHHYME
ncbi:hypothetical protein C0995_011447 [Termitomyces sp. Mi166|nr:hypothetical protein C0995_011447 [Termitomyces sp. Mi166\